MPNKILFHNNQNESKYLDSFENIFTITNDGNFNWKFEGENIDNTLEIPKQFMKEFPHIILKLKYLSPIFSRHYDDLPLMELHYRKIAFTILQLATYLKPKQIDVIFFPFSANHWIEGFILEIAGELLNTKIVFLFPIYIDFQLLPLIQTNGIESRKIISHNFSNNCITDDALIKIQGAAIKIQEMVSLERNKSITKRIFLRKTRSVSLFILVLSKRYLRKRLKNIVFSQYKDNKEIKKPTLVTEINILKQQFTATKHFLNMVEADSKQISTQMTKGSFIAPPIILFAHYQPEASSFPEGGVYANTIDLVMKLRAGGYSGKLFYKEHPNLIFSYYSVTKYPLRIGTARSIEYYEQLRNLGCSFITNITLAEEDYIALTTTGTIAIERSLRGFKSIVAGHPWYKGLPGTISLENFLNNDIEKKLFFDQKNIRVAAFDFLKNQLDNKLMQNGLNLDMFGIEYEEKNIVEFRKEFNDLIRLLKETKNLNNL